MKKYKLGDILELQRGYDLPHSEMEEGNVPVAGSSGIIGYHSISKIDPPCITIGRSGSVGKLFFYNEAIWPHNTSLYIKSFKNNNEKYIFYLLKTVDFERLCDSSVVPSLNRNFVYPIKVPFYDNIADQQKIAAVLSSLDDKIALNNRINAKLEQMAKRLYDYWFVQFDFPNADGRPYKSTGGKMVWNEELKREIPEGWEVKKLGEILILLKDGTHNPPKRQEKGIPLLTGTMFGNNFLDYDKGTYISEADYKIIHSQYEPHENDVIITKIGTLGNVNLLRNIDIPVAIHCNSALLRFDMALGVYYPFSYCKSDLFKMRLKAIKG